MKGKASIKSLFILLISLVIFSGCVSKSRIEQYHDWKIIDTEYFRLFYTSEDAFVKEWSRRIDGIYREILRTIPHPPQPRPEDGGRYRIFFSEGESFSQFTDSPARAGHNSRYKFICVNLEKKDDRDLESTLRHELIHAFTLSSADSLAVNVPSWFREGIALYHQMGMGRGNLDRRIINEMIREDRLYSWSNIEGSSGEWPAVERAAIYNQASATYDYLIKYYGKQNIIELFYQEGDFYTNLEKLTNKNRTVLEEQCKSYLYYQYGGELVFLENGSLGGGLEWEYIDTEYCRLYYREDETFVRERAKVIDTIFIEVWEKIGHRPANSEKGELYSLYFMEQDVFAAHYNNSKFSAYCSKDGISLNMAKDKPNWDNTIRHELIHAFTLNSECSVAENIPGWFIEGIAVYYQMGFTNGSLNESGISSSIEIDGILEWKVMEGKSGAWDSATLTSAYLQSPVIYSYLILKYGEEGIVNLFFQKGDFYSNLEILTNTSPAVIEKEWREFMRKNYIS
ncbi:MAG: hypothetical protein PQJ59_14885 [Spirochaetales bacterium]|nr:hypothetical protein [Spirochaetales bacterium]